MENNKILRAGTARAEINTHKRPVHDPLYAKALVLDDGGQYFAVIAMDAVAIGGICDISDAFLGKLRERIAAELPVAADRILINATHTHTAGPMLCGEEELLDQTFAAVRDACHNLREVTAGAGMAAEDRIAINRTLRLKNGMHQTIRQANPCAPDEEVEALGPSDPTIGVLRFDTADGQPYAILYTFSCHPLLGVADGAVTANYPGFASKIIEDVTGAAAIFLQGTLGDMIEVLFKDYNRPKDSEPMGRMLALGTLEAVRGIRTEKATVSMQSKTVRFPRKLDYPACAAQIKEEREALLKSMRTSPLNFKSFLPLYLRYMMDGAHPADYQYRYMHAQNDKTHDMEALDAQNRAFIDKYLYNIRAMEKICQIQDDLDTLEKHYQYNLDSGEETVACEVVALRIGEFVMVSCPGEALVEIGQNVKKMSPYPHTYVISPSNGYVHYSVPANYYGKGGYEETECMLAPEWQEIYEDTVRELIGKL